MDLIELDKKHTNMLLETIDQAQLILKNTKGDVDKVKESVQSVMIKNAKTKLEAIAKEREALGVDDLSANDITDDKALKLYHMVYPFAK